MKTQLLLLLSLLAFSVCKFDQNSPIYQNLKEILENLEKNITNIIDTPADQQVLSITGKGFTYFSKHGNAYKLQGVKEENLGSAIKQIAEMVKLPKDKIPVAKASLELLETCDYEEMIMFGITYKAKGSKNAYFTNVVAQQREKEDRIVYDFVIGTVDAEFDLAPDYYILEQKKKRMFGLFTSSTWKINVEPKVMTEEQAKQITQIFQLSVVRSMAAIAGITEFKE